MMVTPLNAIESLLTTKHDTIPNTIKDLSITNLSYYLYHDT